MKYKTKNHKSEEITVITNQIFQQVIKNLTGKEEITQSDVEVEVGNHTKPEFVKEVSKMILKKAVDEDIFESPYLWVRIAKKIKAWREAHGHT